MSLNSLKRGFLKRIVSGVRIDCKKANEIGTDPSSDIEIFIRKHLLVQTDKGDYEFSRSKFLLAMDVLDFELLCHILLYFDENGFTLETVFKASKINPLELSGREIYIGTLIDRGEMKTFLDFISF